MTNELERRTSQLVYYVIRLVLNQSDFYLLVLMITYNSFSINVRAFYVVIRWRVSGLEEINSASSGWFLVPVGFLHHHRLPIRADFLHLGPSYATTNRQFICRFGKQK